VSGRRNERLGEEIREAVATVIAEGLKDPRIGFITVTRVSLTADLRTARVYVGVLGEPGQRDKSLAGLRQAAGYIRREVGRRIRARHTPELSFHYDTGLDATDRIAQILKEASAEPGAETPDGPGDDED
jgi:ribosome-binding factor A